MSNPNDELAVFIRGAHFYSADEINAAVAKAKTGDKAALEIVRQHTCRYVLNIACKFGKHAHADWKADLFQHGMLGVIRAVATFDPKKGANFLTYSSSWVKQYITLANFNNSAIKSNKNQPQRSITMHWNEMEREYHKAFPDSEQIDLQWMADKYGFKLKDVELVYQSRIPVASLDMPLGDDGEGATLENFIDSGVDTPEEQMMSAELKKMDKARVDALISLLDERQQEVIRARVLVHEEDDVPTLESFCARWNCSRERVRQIQMKGIERLKEYARLAPSLVDRMVVHQNARQLTGRLCPICKEHRIQARNKGDRCSYCKHKYTPKLEQVDAKPQATVTTDLRAAGELGQAITETKTETKHVPLQDAVKTNVVVVTPAPEDLTDEFLLKCVDELTRRYRGKIR